MICNNCIHNAVCEREHFENHCGYKHTEADVIIPELEKIREEAQEQMIFRVNLDNGNRLEFSIDNMSLSDIIDNHINNLKEI